MPLIKAQTGPYVDSEERSGLVVEGSKGQATTVALHCVFEQGTLSSN